MSCQLAPRGTMGMLAVLKSVECPGPCAFAGRNARLVIATGCYKRFDAT